MKKYLITETNHEFNQVPEIWETAYDSEQEAYNAFLKHISKHNLVPYQGSQFSDLLTEGYVQTESKLRTFTLQSIII